MKSISGFYRKIEQRIESGKPDSYTRQVVDEGIVNEKFLEETFEVIEAPEPRFTDSNQDDVVSEAGDALYFLSVMMNESGIDGTRYMSILEKCEPLEFEETRFGTVAGIITEKYLKEEGFEEESMRYVGQLKDKILKTPKANWESVLSEL